MVSTETNIRSPWNILILCTGNSARSIMAEALFNHEASAFFQAFSAGSRPTGEVNPYAIELLTHHGFNLRDYYSKSWLNFTRPDAPDLDFVLTVCTNAANETCPVLKGTYLNAQWIFPDPAAFDTADAARAAFQSVFLVMQARIRALKAAINPQTDKAELHRLIQQLVDRIPYTVDSKDSQAIALNL